MPLAVGPAISANLGREGKTVFIATLIAKERLSVGDISAAEDALAAAGIAVSARRWIEDCKACDLFFREGPETARAVLETETGEVDVVVQPEASRRRKLLVADMDSTMIGVECIDELADYAGLKSEVAAVTERAMRGELAFEEALRARVALLAGMDEKVIDRCRAERVRLTSGARALVRTVRREGGFTVLVSGGFTRFAEPVAEEIGFDRVVSNRLLTEAGRLTGAVEMPIVGAAAKRQALLDSAAELGLGPEESLAIGDGANDIPMIEAAGLGVAYHAKPAVVAAAGAVIAHNDLTALLYAQGYPRTQWEADRD